jgi:hypothetical protein
MMVAALGGEIEMSPTASENEPVHEAVPRYECTTSMSEYAMHGQPCAAADEPSGAAPRTNVRVKERYVPEGTGVSIINGQG